MHRTLRILLLVIAAGIGSAAQAVAQTPRAGMLSVAASTGTAVAIPDHFALGSVSPLRVEDYGVARTIEVEVRIAHPRPGDLRLQLQCPNGELVPLELSGRSPRRIFNAAFRVTQCAATQIAGDWKLRVSDTVPNAAGSLLGWRLRVTANTAQTPLLRIDGVKDWYLIGNAITPGNDVLALRVGVQGKVHSVAAGIDGAALQPLQKSGDGFAADLDIAALPPGEHLLTVVADRGSAPVAALRFRRSHPLYALLTTDWDTSDSSDAILALHDTLHQLHPGLQITHFFGPYTFTDAAVTPARRGELVAWLRRLQQQYGDEIGLHIHPYCNFVATVLGVACRSKPSDSDVRGDRSGYTVLSSAYSEREYLQLLRAADALFMVHGLTKPTAFRTGSWAANGGVLRALAADGFTADSSANNWARIEESRHDGNGMLYVWNRRHWRPINDNSQPYYPNAVDPAQTMPPQLPILEIPDNGSLVDYVTGAEMTAIFNAQWRGRPLHKPATFVFGFHPVSYSDGFNRRISKALTHFDRYRAATGAGPVVYATASRIAQLYSSAAKP